MQMKVVKKTTILSRILFCLCYQSTTAVNYRLYATIR